MPELRFRLVNVFTAGSALSGNPLCVFEDGSALDSATMQALALQFNLSETTFVLRSSRADACVRIFAPSGEMPFAGHPTLGTAHVVRDLCGLGDKVSLDMHAGVIPVERAGERYVLTAAPPRARAAEAPREVIARMLNLAPSDIAAGARWVSTGNEQLLVPLASEAALRRATPDPELAATWANDHGMVKIYVFTEAEGGVMPVRFFFQKSAGVLAEDPGTGSAAANLGGWWLAEGRPLPWSVTLHQGDALGRPCRLLLEVGADRSIRVGGEVQEIASGVLRL